MSDTIPFSSLSSVPGRARLFAMISTARSREYTPHCVRTFFENTPIRNIDRVVVINNDDPTPLPLPTHSRLEIITHTAPLGFAHNANLMIEQALAEERDLYLLNNDLIFSRDWLGPVAEHEDAIVVPSSNQDSQYAGTIIIPAQGQVSTMLVLSPSIHLDTYRESPYLFDAIAHAHRMKNNGYLGLATAPFFCVKIPLSILKQVGKFDTSFGQAGGEDYDYSLRAWMAGFPTARATSSFLLHFWGRSTWNVSTPADKRTDYDTSYDRSFVTIFQKKWGAPLAELVLNTNLRALQAYPGADDALARLDISTLISILGANQVSVRLP
jgi:GT2 family glycosyltransferase